MSKNQPSSDWTEPEIDWEANQLVCGCGQRFPNTFVGMLQAERHVHTNE